MSITVLCHGVFDVIHPGHLEHFRKAKLLGDRLIVAILGDAWVRKGPERPMFDQERRAEMLRALRIVDEVTIEDSPVAMPVLERLRPGVFCKGPDYHDPRHQFAEDFQREKAFVESYGGKVVLTDGFTSSSTAIISHMKYSDPVLDLIRREYGIDGVLSWIEKAQRVSVLVAGEEILDEYVYVRPLFKSAKENIVSFAPAERETWAGGASVVETDIRQFAGQVNRVRGHSPIHKLRYVDNAFHQKLFALVESSAVEPLEVGWLNTSHEMVVVADYGHGLIDAETARQIAYSLPHRFLALTVQSNSSNWGFNLLTKWPTADYVVADRNELQLALANRTDEIEFQARQIAAKMGIQYLAMTLGHEGCLVLQGDRLVRLPALAEKVVDRMGAGDAFLAATAPLAWAGAPAEIIALVGNVAGAIKVGKLGNQSVTRAEVELCLRTLLG